MVVSGSNTFTCLILTAGGAVILDGLETV